jgi:Tol biopolymer transport system component
VIFAILVAASGVLILLPETIPQGIQDLVPLLFPGSGDAGAAAQIDSLTSTAQVAPLQTATRPPASTAAVTTTSTSALSVVPTVLLARTQAAVPPLSSTAVGEVAFVSDRSGVPQVYISDVGGLTIVPVTNLPDGACQPAWSPDGMRLVFVSPCRISPVGRPLDVSEGPAPDTALYLVNADGSGLVALPTAPGGDSEPAWSPEGQRIAFTSLRDGRPLIYVLDLVDQSVTRLTEPSPEFDQARQPAWSPFGNQLVFTKKRVDTFQIWSMTDSGQGEQPISRGGQQFWDFAPTWSPDGALIFYTQRNAEGPVLPWIMSIPYERRNTEQSTRLRLSPLPVEKPHVSPDGLWLVFEGKGPEENRDIFISTIAGELRQRVTTDPGMDFHPAWRPTHNP